MRAIVAFALFLAFVPLAPAASGDAACDPGAWEEGVSVRAVAVRAAAGHETLYLVSHGAPTLGQSTFEVWREVNGLDGLQAWEACGAPADAFVASACVFRTGAVGALECPAATVADPLAS